MRVTNLKNRNMQQSSVPLDDLTMAKIEMWSKKKDGLQKEFEETMIKRGEAAAMGDLRENGAYQTLTEQGEVLSARIKDIDKMIQNLKRGAEA